MVMGMEMRLFWSQLEISLSLSLTDMCLDSLSLYYGYVFGFYGGG